jgi:NADPH-dependent curcumin reductase CurA
MKWLILLIAVSFLTFTSCKCCKSHKSKQTEVAAAAGAHTGTVSHQYRATGCKTVIIVDGDERVTIIPVEGLPESMDVDGTKISFDYTTLRMPQPEGCNTGLPASLTNVSLNN